MPPAILKEIPDQKGYFADSGGNVYSLWVNKGIHGLHLGNKMKLLKGCKGKTGHIYIRFGRGGKVVLIHRLIHELFIGPIPEGLNVCHKNDIPHDNRASNLYAGTQKDNMRDCVDNGHYPVGEKNKFSKLNESDVIKILRLKETKTVSELSNLFGVTKRNIRCIISRKTWRHIKYE